MSSNVRSGFRPRDIVLALVTVVVLIGVYVLGTALWQKQFGLSQATASDCRTAQELIDSAQAVPQGKAEQKAAYDDYRERWATISDGYLKGRISRYVDNAYAAVDAESPSELSAQELATQVAADQEQANGHCRSAGVTIVMPALPQPGSK